MYRYMDEHPELSCKVFMSYLEVYQEGVYDLLDTAHSSSGGGGTSSAASSSGSTSGSKRSIEQWQKVALREGREGRLELQGVKVYTPANEQQALNLLFLGWMNRSMAETAMNQASSRSHCVLTISLE